jgi:RNA polymerase sigma factor (sigma-70 family)
MAKSKNHGTSRRRGARANSSSAPHDSAARTTSASEVTRRPQAGAETGAEIEQIYLDEISEISLLDRDSEVEVATVMDRARNALVEHILMAPCHFLPAVEALRARPGDRDDRDRIDHLISRLRRAQSSYESSIARRAEEARPPRAPLTSARRMLKGAGLRIVDLQGALERFDALCEELDRAERRRRRASTRADAEDVIVSLVGRSLMTRAALVKHRARLTELRRAFNEAKSVLYVRNLRLVVYIAKKYRSRYMPFLDLVQEGNLGLMKAVDRFEVERGFKFSTYATWWIRQAISRALAEKSRIIRIPVHMIENLTRVERLLKQIPERGGATVDAAAEAEPSGTRVDGIDVQRLTRLLKNPVSLDQSYESGESHALNRIIVSEDPRMENERELDREVVRTKIRQSFRVLNRREQDVLKLRYGLEGEPALTLDEIGRRYSVSRERVRQIEIKALRKLRVPDRRRMLEPLLDSVSA